MRIRSAMGAPAGPPSAGRDGWPGGVAPSEGVAGTLAADRPRRPLISADDVRPTVRELEVSRELRSGGTAGDRPRRVAGVEGPGRRESAVAGDGEAVHGGRRGAPAAAAERARRGSRVLDAGGVDDTSVEGLVDGTHPASRGAR